MRSPSVTRANKFLNVVRHSANRRVQNRTMLIKSQSCSGVRPGRRVHVQQEGFGAREEAGGRQGASLPVPRRPLPVHQKASLRCRRLGQQLRVPTDTALLRPAPDGANVAAGHAADAARAATRW